ncbi:MAG: hypothetical protein K9I29_01225 [Bacteroidales bacterium]|nr:hypothetical protein [Bacteroidales bacterium]
MQESSFFMKRFIVRLTIFTLVIAGLAGIFKWLSPDDIVTPLMFPMIGFFYVLSLIIHLVLVNASKKKFRRFNNQYMISTVVKLLLFMVILIAYVFTNPGDAVNFLITFLILYVLYTGFEVISIVKATRKIKSEENQPES